MLQVSLYLLFFCPLNLVKPDNLNYKSQLTILFQRLSVVVVDALLAVASYNLASLFSSTFSRKVGYFLTAFVSLPLLLVDHIHFQYNGLLFGILLLTVYFSEKKQSLLITLSFSSLVLMKHLFVPFAPIFGIVILSLLFSKGITLKSTLLLFLCCLVAVTMLTFAFGPFLYTGGLVQLQQIFLRLFPFGRGLIHAYWAANFWGFYCFLDKICLFIVRRLFKLSVSLDLDKFNSSSGIVGTYALAFLPQIEAGTCLVIVILFSCFPAILILWRNPSKKHLLRALVFSSLSSFMFGYHVHEKAIMIPIILQGFLCQQTELDAWMFIILTSTGIVSLFPLIPGEQEWMIKGF